MFTAELHPQTLQRAICLVLAAVIVSSSLALGFIGVLSMERNAVEAFATMRV